MKDRGFTLMEVLLAMTILALVMGLVFSTYFAQNRVEQAARGEAEAAQSARLFLDLFLRDVNQTLAPGTAGLNEPGLAGEPLDDGRSKGHQLTLVSRTGMALGMGSGGLGGDSGPAPGIEPIVRVVYRTEPGRDPDGTPTGSLSIVRRAESLLGQGFQEETVCPGVNLFRLTYLDEKGRESGSWSDRKKLPAQIRVDLELAPLKGPPKTFALVCGPLTALAWKRAK